MKLKDRVVIITEKNINRLLNLYEEIKDVDELSKIVNNHLSVVIDEIEEDSVRQRNEMAIAKMEREYPNRREIILKNVKKNRVPHCKECEFLKMYEYVYKCDQNKNLTSL